MKRHPLSALFYRSDLVGTDLQELAINIKAQGQLVPITLYEGMVLDGWNRLQACEIAGSAPVTINLAPDQDPWEFVKAINMVRRHMSPAERVAVMLLHDQMEGAIKIDHPQASVREIQKDLDVSFGTAQKAKKIAEAKDPKLTEALADKRVSLDQAVDLAKLPEPERREALEHPATFAPKAPKAKADPEGCPSCKDLREELEELISSSQAENEEFQAMVRVLDADDKAAQLRTEVKRLTEQNRILTQRLNAKMAECSAITKDATRWMKKAERLEKQLKVLDQDQTFEKVVSQ